MSRKVYVNVNVRLIVELEDGVELDHAMEDMSYLFAMDPDQGEVLDEEIREWTVEDSK
jgi:hypothetical protein